MLFIPDPIHVQGQHPKPLCDPMSIVPLCFVPFQAKVVVSEAKEVAKLKMERSSNEATKKHHRMRII